MHSESPSTKVRYTLSALFRALSIIAIVVLVVLSLFARMRIVNISDSCNELRAELEELEEENIKLNIEYESAISLEKLEEYAVSVLGMQKPTSEQIKIIESTTGDRAEILREKG